jgi:pyruvate/2-oxoglutarate dehydrogenase complex dihydrolipoamide dehydrogenase (E3) component
MAGTLHINFSSRQRALLFGGETLMDVVVIGAGPAGIVAAHRAAELGAQTVLVTRGEVGGMAANDGPIPVRVLAQAARLLREAKQLGKYGISVSEPILDYSKLLARTREVVHDVREHAARREQLENVGVTIYDNSGIARFVDAHTIETGRGLRVRTDKIILSAGGTSRRLPIPGFELTSTHSDAWSLAAIPPSMIVVGAGATGVQVASIFQALGSRVQLFQAGPRILPTEDEDVSAVVTTAFRESGMVVRENFGTIESFEKTPSGVRMTFTKEGARDSAEATLVVVAIGWVADTAGLNLPAAGVETNARGYVQVDPYLQTSAPNIFAAGDITGRLMLVPQGVHDGFVAATNAVRGATMTIGDQVSPIGSFTEPEYAQVGITEAKARETHDVVVSMMRFDETPRTIIDGRTTGFCKLIVDRATAKILGCHVVGERAVEIAQVVAIAIAGGLRVDNLARIPLSFPTYAGIIARAAYRAAQQIYPEFRGQDAVVEK